MIKHVVLYKFKPQISEEEINEIISNFNRCKEALENRLIEIEFGKNCSLKKEFDNGFEYGLFMTFKDETAIKDYNQLEFHKNAQEIMKPHQEKLLVFDIKY
ncbi:MAG: Dabb family protein [Clostridia bacterium]|nr:Dabb family protein [Clostridia bacterium]